MSNPKQQRQRRLQREQAAIDRRLHAAAGPNLGGPLLQRARIGYEWSERDHGVVHGGMGMIARLVQAVGVAKEINASVKLLKVHRPYHESDHVLNIAYNALCGGTRLEDTETRRNTTGIFLEAIAATEPDVSDAMKRWNALKTLDLPALNHELRAANLPEVQIESDPHEADTGMDMDEE